MSTYLKVPAFSLSCSSKILFTSYYQKQITLFVLIMEASMQSLTFPTAGMCGDIKILQKSTKCPTPGPWSWSVVWLHPPTSSSPCYKRGYVGTLKIAILCIQYQQPSHPPGGAQVLCQSPGKHGARWYLPSLPAVWSLGIRMHLDLVSGVSWTWFLAVFCDACMLHF